MPIIAILIGLILLFLLFLLFLIGTALSKYGRWLNKRSTKVLKMTQNEEQTLLSRFIELNSVYGLWLIHDNAYTANLTNVHAVESKRDEYPIMVTYRRVGALSNVEWTVPLHKFMAKAIVGFCIPVTKAGDCLDKFCIEAPSTPKPL